MSVARLNIECISCLLNKYLKSVPENLSDIDKTKYMQGILKIIGEADISKSAPEIIGQIIEFKNSYGEVNDSAEIKNYFNNFFLTLEKDIELKIKKSENPLKSAVKYAMVGNL